MNDQTEDEDTLSPCIGVCMMDPQTDLCDGCYRTMDEIAEWWDLSSEEKKAVHAAIDKRVDMIMEGTYEPEA